MKFTVVLASALLALPASAKTWVDAACVYMLESRDAELPFVFASTDGQKSRACKVLEWPMNTDIATLECDDGSTPKVAFMPSEQVLFDGIHLYPKGHEAIICD